MTTTEKAASQEHFIDLCRMVGEPTPHEADPTGDQYAFERRVEKAGGGDGFADVWKRGFFAWEYKGKRKDLKAAYVQLLGYKDDLGNPPLLIVSVLDRATAAPAACSVRETGSPTAVEVARCSAELGEDDLCHCDVGRVVVHEFSVGESLDGDAAASDLDISSDLEAKRGVADARDCLARSFGRLEL